MEQAVTSSDRKIYSNRLLRRVSKYDNFIRAAAEQFLMYTMFRSHSARTEFMLNDGGEKQFYDVIHPGPVFQVCTLNRFYQEYT